MSAPTIEAQAVVEAARAAEPAAVVEPPLTRGPLDYSGLHHTYRVWTHEHAPYDVAKARGSKPLTVDRRYAASVYRDHDGTYRLRVVGTPHPDGTRPAAHVCDEMEVEGHEDGERIAFALGLTGFLDVVALRRVGYIDPGPRPRTEDDAVYLDDAHDYDRNGRLADGAAADMVYGL